MHHRWDGGSRSKKLYIFFPIGRIFISLIKAYSPLCRIYFLFFFFLMATRVIGVGFCVFLVVYWARVGYNFGHVLIVRFSSMVLHRRENKIERNGSVCGCNSIQAATRLCVVFFSSSFNQDAMCTGGK